MRLQAVVSSGQVDADGLVLAHLGALAEDLDDGVSPFAVVVTDPATGAEIAAWSREEQA